MERIVVCLFPLLLSVFMVEAGTVPVLYDEGSKGYYRIHDEPATWLTAYTICVKEEGRLAMVTNETKAFFLAHFPENDWRVFLGFNKWESGSWRTIQDQSLSEAGYEKWNKGREPNNASGRSRRCGAMYRDGTLDDFDCDDKCPFICQINTLPEEYIYYDYYEGTKTYYKIHVKPATWLTALTTCLEESGNLAIINNQHEADLFVRNFPANSGSMFLGFNNWERNNSWLTIDGKPLSEVGYEKWARGEPNTGSGTQRCGAMYKSGEFDDNHCDTKLPFICEIKSSWTTIKRNDDSNGSTEPSAIGSGGTMIVEESVTATTEDLETTSDSNGSTEPSATGSDVTRIVDESDSNGSTEPSAIGSGGTMIVEESVTATTEDLETTSDSNGSTEPSATGSDVTRIVDESVSNGSTEPSAIGSGSTRIVDESDSISETTEDSATTSGIYYGTITIGDETDVEDASGCEDMPLMVQFCKKLKRDKQCHLIKNLKEVCCKSCSKEAKRTLT